LIAAPASESRQRALKRWAERASLPELVYVLRRPPHELRDAERTLTAFAVERAPRSRDPLRRRLLSRLLQADPKAKASREDLRALIMAPPPHPHASIYRVSALLPDSGDYQDYGRSVLQGIQAGLRQAPRSSTFPIELRVFSTGDDRTSRAVAAMDSAAALSGAVIGELLSTPTMALAAAARMTGLPLLSPTATDESIGAIGPTVFQIGPSGWERGATLARAVLGTEPRRIGILVSSALQPSAFARGFAAAASELHGTVVWKTAYAAGSINFKDEVRELTKERVELLFWDGDPREAEALLRQLTRDRVSVQICGGEVLAPEQHHPETRVLLEGVQYVSDDWRLEATAQARLDSLVADLGGGKATSLHIRGYLAGRMVQSAIARGALCPEEVATRLRERISPKPELGALGFLDLRDEGALLEVYTVRRGRGVTAP